MMEAQFIGRILINAAYGSVSEEVSYLRAEMFSDPVHRLLFSAITECVHEGGLFDVETVRRKLRGSGDEFAENACREITAIIRVSESFAHPMSYARTIREQHELAGMDAALRGVAGKIADGMSAEDARSALSEAYNAIMDADTGSGGYSRISDIIAGRSEDIINQRHMDAGIMTGHSGLDNILYGFKPSDFIVVAARPSVGKTAFMLDIARRVAMNGTKVGILSLEMASFQILDRMVASETGMNIMTRAPFSEDQKDELRNAYTKLSELPICIDDSTGMTATDVRNMAGTMVRRDGINLLLVDYLQLIDSDNPDADGEYARITEVSKAMKRTARELGIPVIALSQLSRDIEKRKGEGLKPPAPNNADLRGSGNLEADADVIVFLQSWASEYAGDETSAVIVTVTKHRNGRIGGITMLFDKETGVFGEAGHVV